MEKCQSMARNSKNSCKQWDGRSHLHGIVMCQSGDANQPLEQTGAFDMKVTTVGIDLAKNVFQLHARVRHEVL